MLRVSPLPSACHFSHVSLGDFYLAIMVLLLLLLFVGIQ